MDTDAELIERWRPGDTRPEILHEVLDWVLDGAELARFEVAEAVRR